MGFRCSDPVLQMMDHQLINGNNGKPKVALVRGPVVSTKRALNNEATPAIALAYIAGYLRKHSYDPFIIDATGEGLNYVWHPSNYPFYQMQGTTFEETIERIPKDTDIIGFSAMFSGEWPLVRDLIIETRKFFPNAIFVAGGEHVTALAEYSLRDCPALDYCVIGEGERVFYDFCEAVSRGCDLNQVPALAYIDDDGQYCQTSGITRIKNIDEIPWPYWPDGYLEKFWAAGKSYGVQTERDMPMLITRGCPYECTFCSNPAMYSRRYVVRDIDDIIKEVKFWIDKYEITGVQLYDLTAIVKRKWMINLLKAIIDNNIHLNWSFPSGTRSEALDEEVLGLLKKAGTNYLVYAPESGSRRTLKMIKKQINLDTMNKSITTAARKGLIVRANLIIGFPGETRMDVYTTLLYSLKLTIKGIHEIMLNLYSNYPGNEISTRLLQEGKIKLSDGYFLRLTTINSDLLNFKPMTFNERIGPKELSFYRLAFYALLLFIGYTFYPKRIWRTIRNLFSQEHAATVIEHRLKDLLRRKGILGDQREVNT